MNSEEQRRLFRILGEVLDQAPERREERMKELCGGDEELLERLRELAREPADEFLDPPFGSRQTERIPPNLGLSFGPYRVSSRLGSGGAGIVWRAEHEETGVEVAVKQLAPAIEFMEGDRRFERECEITSMLIHPSIITVYEADLDAEMPYIAMQYHRFGSLRDEIARLAHLERGSPSAEPPRVLLGPREDNSQRIAQLIEEAAEALHYAHQQGIIHRDVKPGNILLAEDGRAVITDFGSARYQMAPAETASNAAHGTLAYMSPEQLSERQSSIDHRADIYSLGAVLYELLTLERAFRGSTSREILRRIRGWRPQSIREKAPTVPRDLVTICERAMELLPRHRYANAAELAADLGRFRGGTAITAQPLGPLGLARRRIVAHAEIFIGAALVLLLLLLFAIGLWIWSENRRIDRVRGRIAEQLSNFESLEPEDVWATLMMVERDHDLPEDIRDLADQLDRRRRDVDAEKLAAAQAAYQMLGSPQPRIDLNSLVLGRSTPEDDSVRALIEAGRWRGAFNEELLVEMRRFVNPLITVRSQNQSLDGARLTIRRVDPVNGKVGPEEEARSIPGVDGDLHLPISDLILPRGRYRLLLRHASGRTGEVDVDLRQAGRVLFEDLRGTRAEEFDEDAMARIAGGRITIENMVEREDAPGQYAARRVRAEVEPFLLDRRPVSNADYARFLDVVGRPRPAHWHVDPAERPADWGERPVTMVSLLEARAYARFVGKRLPTRFEWELATRGEEGSELPWPADSACTLDDFNFGGADYWTWSRERGKEVSVQRGLFDWYVASVRAPVALEPPKVTRNGLLQPVGNVREWVEQPVFERMGGGFVPVPANAYRLGANVGVDAEMFRREGGLRVWWDHADETLRNPDTGFRCAKGIF